MAGNHFKKKAFWSVALFCLLCFVASTQASFGDQPVGTFDKVFVKVTDTEKISRIMSVLAIRRSGGKALGKAAGKLSAMNERELRLISSLCDRISTDRSTAGSDIAFSLITVMIVLS